MRTHRGRESLEKKTKVLYRDNRAQHRESFFKVVSARQPKPSARPVSKDWKLRGSREEKPVGSREQRLFRRTKAYAQPKNAGRLNEKRSHSIRRGTREKEGRRGKRDTNREGFPAEKRASTLATYLAPSSLINTRITITERLGGCGRSSCGRAKV